MKSNKKQIITFFAIITITMTSTLTWYLINPSTNITGIFGLVNMWSPGIAAIITRLIYQKNLRSLGWKWGKWRYQSISYFLPFLVVLVVYSMVWIFGIGDVSIAKFMDNINRSLLGMETTPSLFICIVSLLTIWMLIACIYALGEEIGWRGFLVYELSKITSYRNTSLIIGLLWSVWHIPAMLIMGYNSGNPFWFSIISFTIMITSLSFIMTWLRLKSGSVWTAVIVHGSHNLFIMGLFDPLTIDLGRTSYITTEFGIGLAIVYALVAFFFWKKRSELTE